MHKMSFHMFNREFQARRWQHPFIPISHYLVPDRSETEEITGQDILLSLSKLAQTNIHLHFLCATELEKETLQNAFTMQALRFLHKQLIILTTFPADLSWMMISSLCCL